MPRRRRSHEEIVTPLRVPRVRAPSRLLRRIVADRAFLRDVTALTSATVVTSGLTALQGLILARWLGPTNFGLVALVTTWPLLIFGFFDAKSQDATIKFVGEYRQANDRARAIAMCKLSYLIDIGVALLTLLVTVLTASWASKHVIRGLGDPLLLILFAASLVPNSLITTSNAVLTVFSLFSLRARIDVSLAAVRFVLVIGAVMAKGGVEGVIVAYAVSGLITGCVSVLVAFVVISRELRSPGLSAPIGLLAQDGRRIGAFLGFTNLTEVVKLAHKQLDIVLVGLVAGPRDAGIYRLAKSSASLLGLPLVPLASVTYQRMMEVSNRRDQLWSVACRSARAVGLPLAGLTLLGGSVLALAAVGIAGPAYASALPAIAMWTVAFSVWNYFFWLRPLYLASGSVHRWFWFSLAAAIAYITVGLPLLHKFGANGLTAAITTFGIGWHVVAALHASRLFPSVSCRERETTA